MQNVLNHVQLQTDCPISLANAEKKILNFQCSVSGSYYTALSYDVIHDVFVLFTFA